MGRLPLAVRDSADRLEMAAGVRRPCLAAMGHLLRHVADPSWSRLRAAVPHLPELRRVSAPTNIFQMPKDTGAKPIVAAAV